MAFNTTAAMFTVDSILLCSTDSSHPAEHLPSCTKYVFTFTLMLYMLRSVHQGCEHVITCDKCFNTLRGAATFKCQRSVWARVQTTYGLVSMSASSLVRHKTSSCACDICTQALATCEAAICTSSCVANKVKGEMVNSNLWICKEIML